MHISLNFKILMTKHAIYGRRGRHIAGLNPSVHLPLIRLTTNGKLTVDNRYYLVTCPSQLGHECKSCELSNVNSIKPFLCLLLHDKMISSFLVPRFENGRLSIVSNSISSEFVEVNT